MMVEKTYTRKSVFGFIADVCTVVFSLVLVLF